MFICKIVCLCKLYKKFVISLPLICKNYHQQKLNQLTTPKHVMELSEDSSEEIKSCIHILIWTAHLYSSILLLFQFQTFFCCFSFIIMFIISLVKPDTPFARFFACPLVTFFLVLFVDFVFLTCPLINSYIKVTVA